MTPDRPANESGPADEPGSADGLPEALLHIAGGQRFALTSAQIRANLTERRFRRALRDGELVRLWRGGYAVPAAAGGTSSALCGTGPAGGIGSATSGTPTGIPGGAPRMASRGQRSVGGPVRAIRQPQSGARIPTLTRLAAAELTLGREVTACLYTAAELYRFSIGQYQGTHVLGQTPSMRDTLSIHRTPPVRALRRAGRFGVVDPAETAVRLAAMAPNPPRALAVLDAALRAQCTTRVALASVAFELHLNQIAMVRELVGLADPRAESPPESWLRWVCQDAGFPPPTPQFWVKCEHGWFRLDLAWPELRLGLEYDGVEFHTGRALTNDRARHNALTAQGWTVLSVTAPMLWDGRAALVRQLADELQRRAAS